MEGDSRTGRERSGSALLQAWDPSRLPSAPGSPPLSQPALLALQVALQFTPSLWGPGGEQVPADFLCSRVCKPSPKAAITSPPAHVSADVPLAIA